MKYILEYIWTGGNGRLRSKNKVIELDTISLENIPEWNYDGSSTGQASDLGNTEVILKPVYFCKNPLINTKFDSFLVLCETFNERTNALTIFNQKLDEHPWFGIEQEYFFTTTYTNVFFPNSEDQGRFYCGVGLNSIQRQIVEEHLDACLLANIEISGTNAEVAPNQWEFQVGPCEGIQASDQLIVARYLLERIAENHGLFICYDPKPFAKYNGSGCHVNFSTKKTREAGGIEEIFNCISKLSHVHKEHIQVYGIDNAQRLTGKHETSSMEDFTYGIGTRNTSVRIPNQVVLNGCGYFEDRRPSANMDPYLVTSAIFKTCCL